MKITEDVRCAAEQALAKDNLLQAGLNKNPARFIEKGAEIYAKI